MYAQTPRAVQPGTIRISSTFCFPPSGPERELTRIAEAAVIAREITLAEQMLFDGMWLGELRDEMAFVGGCRLASWMGMLIARRTDSFARPCQDLC